MATKTTTKTPTPSTTTAPTTPSPEPEVAYKLTTPEPEKARENADGTTTIRIAAPPSGFVWQMAKERTPVAGAKLIIEAYKFPGDEARDEAELCAFAALTGCNTPALVSEDEKTVTVYQLPKDEQVRTAIEAFRDHHDEAQRVYEALTAAQRALEALDVSDLPEAMRDFEEEHGSVDYQLKEHARTLADFMDPGSEQDWDKARAKACKASRLRWNDFLAGLGTQPTKEA